MYRYTTKQQYNINRGKSFLLGVWMGLTALFGCEKPDNPTPPNPQPDPTDTIVIPTKEVIIDVDWNVDGYYVPADSVQKMAACKDVKYVFMNMVNKVNQTTSAGEEGCPCGGYPTRAFHRACDSIYSVADKCNDKFRLSGTVLVSRYGGAQLPDTVYTNGMWLRDSIALSKLGLNIKRQYGN
ncbi:MAG: hypothetical protein IJR92_03700 [Alphaproteobacteria bacterium]|nr:hypothetical protein [Alphaproteobacteria bacterium]